jgi:RNA polymerase sigma-70 factor (ECF subfamily)
MDPTREQALLKQAQAGDSEAFAALYHAHVQVIFRYIAYRVNDMQLAEDLTGDVFTKALESLPKYVDQGRPLRAWLYRIARARVIDHYRKVNRRAQESELDEEAQAVTMNLDDSLLRRQAAKALREAITHLTDEQQQVVILRFFEGHRIEVVAQMMGKQPNAIKALQFRAIRTLASRLERKGFDIEMILAGIS